MKKDIVDKMMFAAKSIGQKVVWIDEFKDLSKVHDDGTTDNDEWNPWLDNKDSFTLIAKLRLSVTYGKSINSDLRSVRVWKGVDENCVFSEVIFSSEDLSEQSTRDAVLMVAADIGKAME